jgi:hypothetical protein
MIETYIQAYVAADEAFVANKQRQWVQFLSVAWEWLRGEGYEGTTQW